jgi:hypothetical protein
MIYDFACDVKLIDQPYTSVQLRVITALFYMIVRSNAPDFVRKTPLSGGVCLSNDQFSTCDKAQGSYRTLLRKLIAFSFVG